VGGEKKKKKTMDNGVVIGQAGRNRLNLSPILFAPRRLTSPWLCVLMGGKLSSSKPRVPAALILPPKLFLGRGSALPPPLRVFLLFGAPNPPPGDDDDVATSARIPYLHAADGRDPLRARADPVRHAHHRQEG